jgi:hypothetical protein
MDQATRPRGGFALAVVIAAGMVLASAGAGVALLAAGGHVSPSRGMTTAVDDGLDLLTVPASVAGHYHAASEDPDVYAEVPCFCGCEAMLGHRSLLDCFVRPQGGWEPHAAGCAVCLDEGEMLQTMLAGGSTPGEIRAEIVDAYTSNV